MMHQALVQAQLNLGFTATVSTPIVSSGFGIITIRFMIRWWNEQEVVNCVAEQLERDCLNFLKGRVRAFALFLTVLLSDTALLEMVDDLIDMVSADLAIVRNSVTYHS
jgi:hypothetical protein